MLQVVVGQRSDFFQAIVPAAAPIGYVAGNGFDLQPIDAPHDAPFVELPASALERVLIDP